MLTCHPATAVSTRSTQRRPVSSGIQAHLEHVELRNGVFRPALLVEVVEEEDVLLHALDGGIPRDEFVVLELRIQNLSACFIISFTRS